MSRIELQEEVFKMRFEEVYGDWKRRNLTQAEAARILGVSERTFRRYINRYEEEGEEGLLDRRMSQPSFRRAPVDEVIRLVERYRNGYEGWNARHFYRKVKKRTIATFTGACLERFFLRKSGEVPLYWMQIFYFIFLKFSPYSFQTVLV